MSTPTTSGRSGGTRRTTLTGRLARVGFGTYQFAEATAALERWMKLAPNDARPYLLRIEIDKRVSRAAPSVTLIGHPMPNSA